MTMSGRKPKPYLGGGAMENDDEYQASKRKMRFSDEPTARGDEIAEYVRRWYEDNRETWFDRHKINLLGRDTDRSGVHADEFMLRFVGFVGEVFEAARKQDEDNRRG